MLKTGETRQATAHDPRTVALHWLTVVLVVAVVAIGFGHDLIEARALRRTVMDVHRLLGLSILAVVLARGVLRLTTAAPRHPFTRLEKVASGAAHTALYILLAALPVVGLLQTAAAKAHPTLFGVISLPALIGKDRELAQTLAGWHGDLAWALIALVGVHAAAALWHHYGRRDDVLRSMSPFGTRARTT